jgi:hypothetical protein
MNDYIMRNHRCVDYAIFEDCPNPDCDNGKVLLVDATTGKEVRWVLCEECEGFGEVCVCSICGNYI